MCLLFEFMGRGDLSNYLRSSIINFLITSITILIIIVFTMKKIMIAIL